MFQVETARDTEICLIMSKFAFNVQKDNRNNYKDQSLKNLCNNITKQIMEKVYDSQKQSINLFNNLAFKTAQQAQSAKRTKLQKDPAKRTVSVVTPLTSEEAKKMIQYWGIDTPSLKG